MRIVHASNFGFKPVKGFLHSTANKLSNGWIRAGHYVVNFSERDVARWAGFGSRQLGRRAANRALVRLCRGLQPDLLALGYADVIDPETVAKIRNDLPDLKVLQWNGDWIVRPELAGPGDASAAGNVSRLLSKAKVVDATFVTSAGPDLDRLRGALGRAYFFPNPIDPSIETARNFEHADLPADIFFAVGASDAPRFHGGEWRDMAALARELRTALPEARLEAYGLDRPAVFGPAYQAAIARAKIGLNISRRNDVPLYSSDRLAHLVGNGLAVCMERGAGFQRIVGEDGFLFYDSHAELIERLKAVLADDGLRRAVAERGYRRYEALCNAPKVATYLIEATFGTLARSPWGQDGAPAKEGSGEG